MKFLPLQSPRAPINSDTKRMNSVEPMPFVSVIVPTYNRANMLGTTIKSLINQSYDKKNYEIIVVDNNSSDNTLQVIEQLYKESPVLINYLWELRQGAHYARNSALKIAKGEILYYTDDDMIADSNLLTEIIRPFYLYHKVSSVTGRYCQGGNKTLLNGFSIFVRMIC